MGNLELSRLTVPIILLFLFLGVFMLFSPMAKGDSSTNKIVNIQTLGENGQSCFYFRRGFDFVEFNVTITNNGPSVVSYQITVSMLDNCSVPIGDVTSGGFSVNPGETKTVQVISDIIPSYAYVGLATASVILADQSTGPISYETVQFYIHAFSKITVSPIIASATAGNSINYTATTYDSSNNTVDITSWVNWNINSSVGGTWSGNTYNAVKSGFWNITATLGSLSGSAMLNVTHASAISVAVLPQNQSLLAGQSQAFTDSANDLYGNNWDITNSSVFTIDSGAGGSWINNTYTSAKAGVWTVTCTLGIISSQSSLIVAHSSINSIDISPKYANLTAGLSQNFSATAYDVFGNSWDATNITAFSINSTAMGSWSGNTYAAKASGAWIVTGSSSNVSNSAYLDVIHGTLVKVVIGSPSSVYAGDLVSFYATAFDNFGNSWDITSLVNWSISSGAGGSWLGNSYTSSNIGNWTVTATYSGMQGATQSTITNVVVQYSPIDFYHQGTVNFRDLAYFESAYVQFSITGTLNPACDLNHDGQINFIDLELFTADYIAYYQALG